ncbi:ubiquinol-cytochrome-c reductase complex assembly factor 3 [Hyperolius riggenbachi]|uniref:ubiquinol-cytochrome-c reductase complex assembly factor 3 n=1 Tax=Hyperolius riggenbachi TaxID=752182 RepID=UPI0035A2821F
MSTLVRIAVATLSLAGFTGVGCLLWALMVPSHEQVLEMRKQAIKEDPAMMAERLRQNELIMKVLKEAAETNVNVASKSSWISK